MFSQGIAEPLQNYCRIIAEPVQNQCRTIAEPVQNQCRAIAELLQNHCRASAEPVQNHCRTRFEDMMLHKTNVLSQHIFDVCLPMHLCTWQKNSREPISTRNKPQTNFCAPLITVILQCKMMSHPSNRPFCMVNQIMSPTFQSLRAHWCFTTSIFV